MYFGGLDPAWSISPSPYDSVDLTGALGWLHLPFLFLLRNPDGAAEWNETLGLHLLMRNQIQGFIVLQVRTDTASASRPSLMLLNLPFEVFHWADQGQMANCYHLILAWVKSKFKIKGNKSCHLAVK